MLGLIVGFYYSCESPKNKIGKSTLMGYWELKEYFPSYSAEFLSTTVCFNNDNSCYFPEISGNTGIVYQNTLWRIEILNDSTYSLLIQSIDTLYNGKWDIVFHGFYDSDLDNNIEIELIELVRDSTFIAIERKRVKDQVEFFD